MIQPKTRKNFSTTHSIALKKACDHIDIHLVKMQDKAVQRVKEIFKEHKSIVNYSPTRPTLLTTEVSDNAMSATENHVQLTRTLYLKYARNTHN